MKKTFSMILAVMVLVLCLSVSAVSVFAEPTTAPTGTEAAVVDLSGVDTPADMKGDAGPAATSAETTAPSSDSTVPAAANETVVSTEAGTTGSTTAVDATSVPATGDEANKLSTDVQTGAGTPIVFAVIAVLAIVAGSVCFIGFKKSKAGK